MRVIALICLCACAPQPATITFDGGSAPVVVHTRDGFPVKRAVVRDEEGTALDPQPYVTWSVDRPDVISLKDGTIFPLSDGTARIEASLYGYLAVDYNVVVDLTDAQLTEAASEPYGGCPVTNYGNGVLTFACDDRDFPRGLAAYLAEHGTPAVTAVSPLVRVAHNDVKERALVTTYLVVTQPH